MKSIVWLRRDFRVHDQRALHHACRVSDSVLPVFVLDPAVLGQFEQARKPRSYFFGALLALRRDLLKEGRDIVLLQGDPAEVIPRFCREQKADSLYFNRDYEPASIVRDRKVTEACTAIGMEVQSFKDHVLFEESEILNGSGEPYRVFTPYKKNCLATLEREPERPLPRARLSALLEAEKLPPGDRKWRELEALVSEGLTEASAFGATQEPGEAAAMKRLRSFVEKRLARYETLRNLPAVEGGARISADLRNGSISPRQVLEAVGIEQEIYVAELLWHDFFMMIGFHFPRVFEGNFNSRYDSIPWRNDPAEFRAWCEGRTGYPIVDAGMRELVGTGFMHNRVRMITAMFLVKDLLIDWRKGEEFFLRHLIDGDAAVNNGNWQWCASTGTDAQPYFRIFNPVTQGKKFDPQGDYIRRFVEERRNQDPKAVHQLMNPVVDHEKARQRTLSAYRSARMTPG